MPDPTPLRLDLEPEELEFLNAVFNLRSYNTEDLDCVKNLFDRVRSRFVDEKTQDDIVQIHNRLKRKLYLASLSAADAG